MATHKKRINMSLDSNTHTNAIAVDIIATPAYEKNRRAKMGKKNCLEENAMKTTHKMNTVRDTNRTKWKTNLQAREIPNVMLDDAHLNCASNLFSVTKSFGKTMSS